jgi:hypothetical protein
MADINTFFVPLLLEVCSTSAFPSVQPFIYDDVHAKRSWEHSTGDSTVPSFLTDEIMSVDGQLHGLRVLELEAHLIVPLSWSVRNRRLLLRSSFETHNLNN